jgi:hypothetical protein
MNDLTTQEQSPPAIAKAGLSAGGPLAALVPQDLDQAFRLAKALSMSGDMVPKHFQGKPEMIMAAIARGMEIGLAPMQALSNIAVINGRASIWGDALPALLQKAGHHLDCELQGEGDQMVAVATLTRGDTGRETVRSFSVAEAKKAGLWGKAGPWQAYPTRMLQMRARSFAARDGAADALMGLQVAEEMQDVAPMKDVTPAPKGPNLAQRLAAPAQQDTRLMGFPIPETPEDGQPVTVEGDVEEAHWTEAYEGGRGAPGSTAWDRGVAAAAEGLAEKDCPYDRGVEGFDWVDALRGAVRAKE